MPLLGSLVKSILQYDFRTAVGPCASVPGEGEKLVARISPRGARPATPCAGVRALHSISRPNVLIPAGEEHAVRAPATSATIAV